MDDDVITWHPARFFQDLGPETEIPYALLVLNQPLQQASWIIQTLWNNGQFPVSVPLTHTLLSHANPQLPHLACYRVAADAGANRLLESEELSRATRVSHKLQVRWA